MGPRREYALRQNKWESVCFALKRLGDCCMQDLLKPVEIGDETRLRTRAGGARDPNFSGAVVGTKAEGASSPAMPALIVEVPMSRTEASFTAIGKKSSQEGSLEIDREHVRRRSTKPCDAIRRVAAITAYAARGAVSAQRLVRGSRSCACVCVGNNGICLSGTIYSHSH